MATLLAKLGIKPFSYGLIVQQARSPSGFLGALQRAVGCCRGAACESPSAGKQAGNQRVQPPIAIEPRRCWTAAR